MRIHPPDEMEFVFDARGPERLAHVEQEPLVLARLQYPTHSNCAAGGSAAGLTVAVVKIRPQHDRIHSRRHRPALPAPEAY